MTATLSALLGVGVGLGLVLIGVGWRHTPSTRDGRRSTSMPTVVDQRVVLRVLAAVGIALLTGLVTGWVVGGLLAGMGTWALPPVLGRNVTHERRVARIEAIAGWAEMLRDTLAAAAGIEQAIVVTAPLAPGPIRAEVTALAARLEAGERLVPGLRGLAADLDDPTADLVVAALIQACQRQARQLGDLLSSLAQAARDQAGMRLRVEASRARTRTSARVVTGTTLAFAGGLVALNREYLSAYDAPVGQLVLLAVGALFTLGFAWLARIARITESPRILAIADQPAAPNPRAADGRVGL